MGSVFIELYTDHAPKTCQNFLGTFVGSVCIAVVEGLDCTDALLFVFGRVELAKRGYYSGTVFHRWVVLS